jgi:hypothetical protein
LNNSTRIEKKIGHRHGENHVCDFLKRKGAKVQREEVKKQDRQDRKRQDMSRTLTD